jgi:ABC-type glycerol-3-phosphate transport system substrate-binding protein
MNHARANYKTTVVNGLVLIGKNCLFLLQGDEKMKPKKISRRDFLKLSALGTAGATLLAACQQAATPEPTEESMEEPVVEVPAVAEEITLVGFSKEGDVADGMKVCVDLVKEMTGVTLEVQSAPEDQFRAKVTADFAAGGGAYDVIFMPYNMMHEYYELGHLLPLDDHIAADPDINIDDFSAALLREYGGWGGGQYALPWKADVYVAFYRKDVFNDPAVQDMFKSRTGMDLKPP